MDLNQYLEVFIDESKEHLQACNEQLLKLEKDPNNLAIVNEIFRSAHTLKGMSATMNFEDLANLTHYMENVLDDIRNEKIHVTTDILDVVFFAVDELEVIVESIASGGDGKRDVSAAVAKLKNIEQGSPVDLHKALSETAASVSIATSLKNTYDQFERTVIEQSKEQGFQCYEITVSLRKDCLLKTARVYMVFEVLEKCGEVIKSVPSVEQLEDEQFDSDFTVSLITTDPPDEIQKKIMKISEIESVSLVPVHDFQHDGAEQKENKDKLPAEAPEQAESAGQSSAESQKQNVAGNKTIRVNIERLDILMNLFEELVIDRGRLEQISQEIRSPELEETVERMSRISGDLQNIILKMRMVPIETVFNRFPRMVRQLAKDLDKELDLVVLGAETELDRTVIDEIGDPLVHLLRNAIDHGVESPEHRLAAGKPEKGTITLKAYHSGNHVFIEIEDDGAGINRKNITRKAISKGIITESEAADLSDEQAYELIMASGFSTAETISDISGRGVGLDVVKSKIQSLGGLISISSVEGKGSVFSIQLPLTLSIISAMLVEVGKEKYAIPLSSILETAIVKRSEIMNAHNQPVIDFRGKVVPVIALKDVFEMDEPQIDDDEFISLVIVRKGDKMAGVEVDSFIGQQEIVLKTLGDYLSKVFAISGATILGDGQVALIIDCNALIK